LRGALLNGGLALVWALLLGEVSLRSLAVGYVIGFALLAFFRVGEPDRGYVARLTAVVSFAGYFLQQLVAANVQVAIFSLRRHPPLHPMIVAVPLRLQQDGSITLLAASITLLPGTVAMGFSDDRRYLYAHAIGYRDTESARRSILEIESRLLRFLD